MILVKIFNGDLRSQMDMSRYAVYSKRSQIPAKTFIPSKMINYHIWGKDVISSNNMTGRY